jgi:two-component system nitrogen regulation response regulator GlnG
MPVSSSVFTILLLTGDTGVQTQLKQVFTDASVTVAHDAASLRKEALKRDFDAVVVEARTGQDLGAALQTHINPARTLVMVGSRAVLKRTIKMMQQMNQQSGSLQNGKVRDTSLEGYLEMKMGDFVKGMRNGSARNLHPMLISAVERPLIASALRETQGNQIQAAELLGLNRNTLRKKIADLHIPLNRTRAKATRTA